MAGPLTGTTLIELGGIGPGPFAGMMLADMGADVIRIDKPGGNPMLSIGHNVLLRNRRSIALDVTTPAGAEVVLRLVDGADGLFEGFRPGVAERLGVGPEVALQRNSSLVYGRMTGWGQTGPMRQSAGHDINYIALTGALDAIGRKDTGPIPPLNLVGDFGGGGMLLAYGMVCGLLHARITGEGQVVDAAMIDGSSALMAMFHGLRSQGLFDDQRGTNLLDTGAPFYDVYETADHKFVSIGALEPKFFESLCDLLELGDDVAASQQDRAEWPRMRELIAAAIVGRTRDELDQLFSGTDACYAPVLALGEVAGHPHHQDRHTFVEVDGVVQPAPAPRFNRSQTDEPRPYSGAGQDTRALLLELGYAESQIGDLRASGVIDFA